MRTATTKLRRKDYARFREWCLVEGSTPYAVLRGLIFAWVEKQERGED